MGVCVEDEKRKLIALADQYGIGHPLFMAQNLYVDQLVYEEQLKIGRQFLNWAKGNTTQPVSDKWCSSRGM